MQTFLVTNLATIGWILGAMALLAALESWFPLQARRREHRAHLGPNLALTGITFATNLAFNGVMLVWLLWLDARGLGLLHALALPAWAAVALAVVWLDFATYVAHVAMHRFPWLWRFHRVHHSDGAVDVTTSIRQHPGETFIRFAFLAVFAAPLGVGAGMFALYRGLSALNALFEHANLRVPRRLDAVLSLAVVTPLMHKVHHSRKRAETDSNYGNLLSLFDRAFATFTPSERGLQIQYGLAEYDDPTTQTTFALLRAPFERSTVGARSVVQTEALRT
jgi:sterol desaturase/sphingolipid hydroxylase (fatty acid hydroxylase superfamily)